MRRATKLAFGALLPAALAAGCGGYLESDDAITNPNNPTVATSQQLFTGAIINIETLYTGDLARTLGLWTRQFAGTDRQFVSLARYTYTEDNFDGAWSAIYQNGGLVDLRDLEKRSDTDGDTKMGGMARVMEAMLLGMGADLWGDIPLETALTASPPPTLTPQAQVYATVQAKLDTAITLLGQNRGTGPLTADLFYGGDVAKWTRLAHSLKARYYLHVAEATPAAYAQALASARLGMQSTADDLRTYQSASNNEQNLWYQFTVRDRAGYISPNSYFVNLLRANNDPRLDYYFESGNANGTITGTTDNGSVTTVASLNSAAGRPGNAAYRQPIVTYAETQLIVAEAALQTGNAAAAAAADDAARAAAPSTVKPAPATSVTLADVMTEKYIALFQNIEVYNDYRRTCLPALPSSVAATPIPARLLYPDVERRANPNIPAPSEQPARNANDPRACPVVNP